MTNDKLSAEERDILDKFERGELRSAPGGEQEMEAARQAVQPSNDVPTPRFLPTQE